MTNFKFTLKDDEHCPECDGPLVFVSSNGISSSYRCADPSRHGDQDAIYMFPVEEW
jgi:hypothetical protein